MSISPARDKLPDRVGDFEVTGVLGQGGSGVVYDARWGHRAIALKVLHPTLVAGDKEREQFLAEARRLAEITHPGVVKVHAVGELPDGRPYLAMEKLAGETLAARLARGALDPALALRLFAQLADAAQALHDRGLVHRDLKPENVVLVAGPDGEPHAVLLDFGIAKSLAEPASTTTQDGGVRGTPAYMAPERFFGAPAAVATDVYELAVVFFAMLAGRLPWDDCGDPDVRLNPLRLKDIAPALPGQLDVEVARALSTRAANRPASARAFAEAVRVAMGVPAAVAAAPSGRMTAEVQATPPAPAWFDRERARAGESADPNAATVDARPTRTRRRRWPWIAVAVAIVGGVAIAAVVATRGGGGDKGVVAAASDDPWAGGTRPTPDKALRQAQEGRGKETGKTEAAPQKSERPLRTELSAALQHFPHDTSAVIGLVVDEVRGDPDLGPLLLAEPTAQKLTLMLQVEGCDLDFVRAIDWVAVGVGPGQKTIDAILSGRWTRAQVEACFGGVRHSEIQHLDQGGAHLTRLHGKDGDRWLGWLDDRTFLITTREREGADWMAARLRATDGPGGVVGELATKLDRDTTAWAIADAAAVGGADLGASLADLPPGQVMGRARLDDGADIHVRIRYPDEATAHRAHDLLVKKIDDEVGGARELGILDVTESGVTVDIKVSLARELLHAVAAKASEP